MTISALSERLQQALSASASGDADTAIALFRQAVDEEPGSPLPPFLLGGEFAQLGRVDEAIQAFAATLLLSPEFHIARYQMGLLQYTSGHAALALVTWQPLLQLPESNALRSFAIGFAALAEDRFADATAHFRAGQALNLDNVPLNNDIQLVIDRIEALNATPARDAEAPTSEDASHVLLSNYRGGSVH
jgi:tetratricopeptide (TPR) repeat protein